MTARQAGQRSGHRLSAPDEWPRILACRPAGIVTAFPPHCPRSRRQLLVAGTGGLAAVVAAEAFAQPAPAAG